jgi:hypothetical protein
VVLNGRGKGLLKPSQAARDRYLRRLVRQGAVTAEQVSKALEECARAPSAMLWIAKADTRTLGRADCVFLAEYGRFPEARDFEINGPYQRICRSLVYDWHYYDEQLTRLHWDEAGRPYVRPEGSVRAEQDVQEREIRRGSFWAFAFVLAVGGIGVPAACVAAWPYLPPEAPSVLWGLGIAWGLCLAALLAATRPRRIRCKDAVLRCGRCRQELTPGQARTGCTGCGALFTE